MSASDHLSPQQFWHGSPNGEVGLGNPAYGIHVGTREAAREALNARIGKRADGKDWDGSEEYGQTLLDRRQWAVDLKGSRLLIHDQPPSPPVRMPRYSDGSHMRPSDRPSIFPVEIIGPMTNTPATPHDDFRANGMMQGQLKRGTAKRGYYYRNVSEDEGSISAVVPGAAHLRRLDR